MGWYFFLNTGTLFFSSIFSYEVSEFDVYQSFNETIEAQTVK